MRPGMYIGKLGDGSSADDGIYILLKEVLDNSIDEFVMGAGKTIEISIQGSKVIVRDFGRGIPLGKVVDVVSKMNTGGKYDSRAFKKSVGLNGVGTKAVNALSSFFRVESTRDGKSASAEFSSGVLNQQDLLDDTTRRKGTKVSFVPAENVTTPDAFDAPIKFRLIVYCVSVTPEFIAVFSVLIVFLGNLNNAIFFSGLLSLATKGVSNCIEFRAEPESVPVSNKTAFLPD